MISRKSIWLTGAMIFSTVLSACTLGATPGPEENPGAVQTQAFGGVLTQVAQGQTQTAQAIPPIPAATNTLQPTPIPGLIPTAAILQTSTPFAIGFTPLSLSSAVPTAGAYSTTTTSNGCNDAWYITDDGPNGNTISAGRELTATFEMYNSGTCTWDEGYSFSFRPEYSSSPEGASLGYFGKDQRILVEPFTKPGESRFFTIRYNVPGKPGEYIWSWRLKDDSGALFGSLVWIKFISVEN